MDIEKLREELGERYFRIDEYFNKTFELFKYIFKTKWGKTVMFFILLMAIPPVNPIFKMVSTLGSYLVVYVLGFNLIKKVVELIENKEKINVFRIILRTVILGIIYSIFFLSVIILILIFDNRIFSILDFIVHNSDPLTGRDFFAIILAIIPFFIILSIIYMFNFIYFTYFNIIYIIRKISLKDALKYGLHINKGNKRRIVIPLIIVYILRTIFSMVVLYIFSLLEVFIPSLVYFRGLATIIPMLILIYGVILEVLIYLNVEYMDIKKSEDKKINLKNAHFENIERIMEIIQSAKNHMEKIGLTQWSGGYPSKEIIENDIKNGESYILEYGNEIVGVASMNFNGEKVYNHLINVEKKYGTIHRLAVDASQLKKGYASKMLEEMEKLCISKDIFILRSDTHRDNKPMEACFTKNGFNNIGICHYDVEDGERNVFEKIIKS